MTKSISQSSSTRLLMRMYHGRADVNEVMEDWGSEGPMLEHIASVRYDQGALMLEFDESQHAQVARNLTGWQVFKAPNYEVRNCGVHVNFPFPRNRREFVGCHNACTSEGADVMYYGDFYIRTVGLNACMCMRLEQHVVVPSMTVWHGHGHGYEQESKHINPTQTSSTTREEVTHEIHRQCVIARISELHFTYGVYVIWFSCIEDFELAKHQTGWATGPDPQYSLEVSIGAATESVMLYGGYASTDKLRDKTKEDGNLPKSQTSKALYVAADFGQFTLEAM